MKNIRNPRPETNSTPAPFPFKTWEEYHEDQRFIDEERWEFEAQCIATQILSDAINDSDREEGLNSNVMFLLSANILYMADMGEIVNEWHAGPDETWHDLIRRVMDEYYL